MASMSASFRSGAIFTSNGRRGEILPSSAFTAASNGRKSSTVCRLRKPGRVRRAHVDDQVVGERARASACSARSHWPRPASLTTLVLPMFTPIGTLRLRGQVRRDHACAQVVEAHAVDQRAIGGQPKKPRLRVTGLRLARHRTDFDEAKAERGERLVGRRVLVEARGQTDRDARNASRARRRQASDRSCGAHAEPDHRTAP